MDFFAKARLQLEQEKPFVLYRKPGEKQVWAILQDDSANYFSNDLSQSGFVFAPFGKGPVFLLPASDSKKLCVACEPAPSNTATPELEIDANAKKDFEAMVARGISAINAGEFDKVVLSRTESVSLGDLDVFEAFERLVAAYPSAFVYLWYHPGTDIWMAATPERLLYANGKHFKTMALAGTQKYQGEVQAEWAQKEKEEQRFVTDFIWDSLEGMASGIELSQPYTYRAGNLLHIRTDISGELDSAADLRKAISALHPTPAVCGLPKEAALRFIVANEGYDREFYSGFLGEFDPAAETDLYVNLRCVRIAKNTAKLFVGCGITKDSDAEKEFFETVNKSLTIRKALG